MAIRALNPTELAEAQSVFGDGLDFKRVRIKEESSIGNIVGRIGAWLKRLPPPEANAITVGNVSYFPRKLTGDLTDMGWLMHELTHQWQYQHAGLQYLFQAAFAPTYVYEAAGQTPNDAVKELGEKGKKYSDFNREQQGDIVRDYYFALKQNQDVSGWKGYLEEVRARAR